MACYRTVANLSKSKSFYFIDDPNFGPEILKEDSEFISPKLNALFEKIEELDNLDRQKHKRTFKHMIFTDLSQSMSIRLLSSAFVANGYTACFNGVQNEGIEMKRKRNLRKTKGKNFGVLASRPIFGAPVSAEYKKNVLRLFNSRNKDGNTHGKYIRFMILDNGFKEGIDLYDVKYVHLFEPLMFQADQKQAIGRATRFCGQKGIQFVPQKGWELSVFIYDIDHNGERLSDLHLKAIQYNFSLMNFAAELDTVVIEGAVDRSLTSVIHDRDTQEIIVSKGPLAMISPSKKMTFEEMQLFIKSHFWNKNFVYTNSGITNKCREEKGKPVDTTGIIKFTPTQNFISHFFTPDSQYKGMLLYQSVGTGKCHARDTPILMYDGTIKMVQDIQVGELLMGDDSTPRRVESLASGEDDLYDIIPTKGDAYTVNSEHILCLKPTRMNITRLDNGSFRAPYYQSNGKITSKTFKTFEEATQFLDRLSAKPPIIEIEVKDYLKLSDSSKKNLKGYRTGVEFQMQELPMDPYLFGLWLGDGTARDPKISSADTEIVEYIRTAAEKMGLVLKRENKYDYRLSSDGRVGANPFVNFLKKYNLVNNKHIPQIFLSNSRENRLNLLAGIIDSDGHYSNGGYEIIQKSNEITKGILFLARSLGYAAYSKKCKKSCIPLPTLSVDGKVHKGERKENDYNRIFISGDLYELPCKLERKISEPRMQKKNVLVTGIDVQHIGRGQYYGFTLDGNHRYLLGDFTVTHNTCTAIATATNSFDRENYTILWVTRHTLKADIWKNMFKQICHINFRERIRKGERIKNKASSLSKNWIQPVSYKQFSNLLNGNNKVLEQKLISRNGSSDPLRKTLIIIDEAHKLYADSVAAAEKPNMEVLERMINNSYQMSGRDSARILLMTATPYTENPFEMIKLLNLLRHPDDKLETNWESFSEKYLTETGQFRKDRKQIFLDEITGYISYLNRSSDKRYFAYPTLHHIIVDSSKKPDRDPLLKFNRYTRNIKDLREQKKMIKSQVEEDYSIKQDECKESCNKIDDQINNLNCNAPELSKEAKKVCKEQYKQFKEKLKECKKKCKDLNSDKKNKIKSNKETSDIEISRLKDEYDSLKDARKNLREFIKSTRTLIKELSRRIKNSDSSKEIKRLKQEKKNLRSLIVRKMYEIHSISSKIGTRFADDLSQETAIEKCQKSLERKTEEDESDSEEFEVSN